MKIGIIPSVQEKYKNQFEYSCDIKLFKFLKTTFSKDSIELLTINHKVDKNYKLIVISGANGNDLIQFNSQKKNIIRKEIDDKFYKVSQKLNIPILGICHGAQYLAKKFSSTIIKKKHIGNHSVKFTNHKEPIIVNSFHTKVISRLGKKLISKAVAYDNTVEFFIHKDKKILGIMWHPERYKNFKKIDKNIVKKLCI